MIQRTSRIVSGFFRPETLDDRWTAEDDMAVEVEVAELLYGIVRAIKPMVVKESGSYPGLATEGIVNAMVENNLGMFIGSEGFGISERMAHLQLEHDFVKFTAHHTTFADTDFTFIDCDVNERQAVFDLWYATAPVGSIVAIHDTLIGVNVNTNLPGFTFPSRRGLTVYKK